MTISRTEPTTLVCPACGQPFDAAIWTLIDTAERPDLREALLSGSLNLVTCPACGNTGPAGGPLLLHDPTQRRVYFAVPNDVDEHRWREVAQGLLYELVAALPEEARLPYLGDVQISQEIDGLREALARAARRRGARQASPAPAPMAEAHPPIPVAAPPPQIDTVLLDWIQTLLAADSPREFQAIVAEHPDLLSAAADAILERLAAEARALGEPAAARAVQQARDTLSDMRAGAPELAPPALPDLAQPAVEGFGAGALSDRAYQVFLAASSPEDLLDAARGHPVLLEPEIDSLIAVRAEAALDAGNEWHATLIEERREALAEIRAALLAEPALLAAVQALLAAENEEHLARALSDHPELLTSAAQQVLMTLAAGARASGDEALAEYAVECRAMLREVRRGLEAHE